MKRTGFKQKLRKPLKRTAFKRKIKTKKPKIKNLKKKLDEVFSKYIRQKYADSEGMVECYTCPTKKHWKEMQCGHFISRSYLATRFDEDNCRPQDVGCNVFGNGKAVEFARKLADELGDGTVEKLFRRARQITKDFPYEEKIKEYEEKINNLSPTNTILDVSKMVI